MPRQDALDALQSMVGEEIHVSDWLTVDQAMIDAFADATLDHQWIHVDPQRAASSRFGSTIAHGFLTLSLVPHLALEAIPHAPPFDDAKMRINYGLDKVRFPQPVPAGARVRSRTMIVEVGPAGESGIQLIRRVTVELEDAPKPACVADQVVRIAF
jgi:acyl dehydratase